MYGEPVSLRLRHYLKTKQFLHPATYERGKQSDKQWWLNELAFVTHQYTN